MSTAGREHRRRHHSSGSRRPALPTETAAAVALTRLTDLLLIAILFGVPACFAGRTPIGQLVFATLAAALAIVWSLRQLAAQSPCWRSTSANWLWIFGVLLAALQTAPLSKAWLVRFSPEVSKLLPLWSPEAEGLLPAAWSTLSLDPSETISGLVTFLSYALLFVVVVQRIQNRDDVGRLFKMIVGSAGVIAVFGLLQYFLSNGQFYWCYLYPGVTTDNMVLGPFTNRNHMAQFLALAVGPTLWWLSVAAKPPGEVPANSFGGPSPQHLWFTVGAWPACWGRWCWPAVDVVSRRGGGDRRRACDVFDSAQSPRPHFSRVSFRRRSPSARLPADWCSPRITRSFPTASTRWNSATV